ncbi:MAG: hypothetical protein MUF49_18975 [Oculatellaceae cyanobacterium Prado106]|jgi:hypothetical protein|nr:hypothetical protein [Oculatellaceae cyanobacterium Prado106]
MLPKISLNAGDHAVQFGHIGHLENLSVDGVLKVEIGSLTGSTINLSSSDLYIPPTPRSTPVRLTPRSFPLLIGRKEEIKIALGTLPYEHSIEFYGSAGVGKTALLRHLSHHPAIAPAFTDGIIYHRLRYGETVTDLLQVLFDAFYESKTRFQATTLQIRQALASRKALVILDGLAFKREDIDQLLNELPDLTFLFATGDRCAWSHVKSVGVQGLALHEAIALVTQAIGHDLNPAERADAEKLCTILEGHPLRILEAIAWIQAEKQSLAAIVQRLAAKPSHWANFLLSSLSKPQRWIIALLTILGTNVALGAEIISGITHLPNVQAVLETLLQRHLIEMEGDCVRLTCSSLETLQKHSDLTPYRERSIHFLTQWVQQQQGLPEAILQESDAILRALEWAVEAGQWSDALVLGRSLEGVLALNGQWGTWETVLQSVLEAARATGEQATEAFALHELGTRSLCLNQVTEAQSFLSQALQIRESLGDRVAIEATTHNLQFLTAIPPIPLPPSQSVPQPRVIPTSRVPKGLLIGGGAMLCLTFGFFLSSQRLFPSLSPSPEPSPSPSPGFSPSSSPLASSSSLSESSPSPSPSPSSLPGSSPGASPGSGGKMAQPNSSTTQQTIPEGEENSTTTPDDRSNETGQQTVLGGEGNSTTNSDARFNETGQQTVLGGEGNPTTNPDDRSAEPGSSNPTDAGGNPDQVETPPDAVPTVSLASFTLSSRYPTRPNGGILVYWENDPLTGQLRLNAPAPAGGVEIAVTSDHPYFADLPRAIYFEAGQQEQTFTFSTLSNQGKYPKQANTVIRVIYDNAEFKYSVLVDTFY